MTLDAAVVISALNPALPAAGDLISEGDDHLRTIKTCIGNFPFVTGPATAGHADLAAMAGSNVDIAPLSGFLHPAYWSLTSGSARRGIDGRFHLHLHAQVLDTRADLGNFLILPAPTSGAIVTFASFHRKAATGVYTICWGQIFGASFASFDASGAAGALAVGDTFRTCFSYHTR